MKSRYEIQKTILALYSLACQETAEAKRTYVNLAIEIGKGSQEFDPGDNARALSRRAQDYAVSLKGEKALRDLLGTICPIKGEDFLVSNGPPRMIYTVVSFDPNFCTEGHGRWHVLDAQDEAHNIRLNSDERWVED